MVIGNLQLYRYSLLSSLWGSLFINLNVVLAQATSLFEFDIRFNLEFIYIIDISYSVSKVRLHLTEMSYYWI